MKRASLFLVLLLVACSGDAPVNSDYNPSIDFSAYRSFSFGTPLIQAEPGHQIRIGDVELAEGAGVGRALLQRARARLMLGDRRGLQADLRRAVESLTNGLGDDHPLTREARALRDGQV